MNEDRLLSAEALEFAPSLLAIQESPPARLPRVMMIVVAALFGILLLWALIGRIDIIASAEGRLVPQTYLKIVQPSDAGIVEEIMVREGDAVKAGQVLLRMDTKLAKADQDTMETELALRSLQLNRIDAELSGRPLARPPGVPSDLFAQVSAQHRDRRQAYEDALAQAREALRRARYDYDAAVEELHGLREVTPALKETADAYVDMGREGYAPQVMVRDKQREYIEKSRAMKAKEATVESLRAAVAAAERQAAQVTSKYRSDLQNERVDAEGQYRKLRQDWVKQEHKTGLLELRAPQSGIVKDLATHTVGTVVSPGTVLLSLVPENEPLVAEVMVRNDDIGFVFPGQPVKVKLAPYPFEKYGMLDGSVTHIGADASDSDGSAQASRGGKDKGAPQQLTYKVLVALNRQTLDTQGQSFRLVAGMQVVAEISQGRRTVMEYLLSPVRKTLHDSGRER